MQRRQRTKRVRRARTRRARGGGVIGKFRSRRDYKLELPQVPACSIVTGYETGDYVDGENILACKMVENDDKRKQYQNKAGTKVYITPKGQKDDIFERDVERNDGNLNTIKQKIGQKFSSKGFQNYNRQIDFKNLEPYIDLFMSSNKPEDKIPDIIVNNLLLIAKELNTFYNLYENDTQMNGILNLLIRHDVDYELSFSESHDVKKIDDIVEDYSFRYINKSQGRQDEKPAWVDDRSVSGFS